MWPEGRFREMIEREARVRWGTYCGDLCGAPHKSLYFGVVVAAIESAVVGRSTKATVDVAAVEKIAKTPMVG